MQRSNPERRASKRRDFISGAGAGFGAFLLGACAEPGAQESLGEAQSPVLSADQTIQVARPEAFSGSIQAAADSLEETGGILYLAAGVYTVSAPIVLPSNVHVLGAGRGAVLQRMGSAASIFLIDSVSGVTIENLVFDVNVGSSSVKAIAIEQTSDPTTDIAIGKCWFYTAQPSSPIRAYALNCAGVTGLRFTENLVEGLDVVASGSSADAVFVTRNHIKQAPHTAIALYAEPGGTLQACLVADNQIEDVAVHGIHVGSPGEGVLVAEITSLVVRGNILRGTWGAAAGILAYFAESSRNWLVTENILENTATGSPPNGSHGIRLSAEAEDASGDNVIVSKNAVRHLDLWGILVAGAVDAVRVSDNRVHDTRGVAIVPAGDGMTNVILASNVVRGGSPGCLVVDASGASAARVMIRSNVLMNASGFERAGLWLVTDEGTTLDVDVRGNRCGDDQTPKTQSYGIREYDPTGGSAGTFHSRYLGNDVSGNAIAGMALLATAPILRDNAGYATSARGTVTVGAAGSASVTHGMPFTPLAEDVTLTLIGAPSGWSGRFWSDPTPGATTFVAHATGLSGADQLMLGWQVTVRDV